MNPILKDVFIAAGISFIVSVILGPMVLPVLRRLKIGQTVRSDGPETHLQKNGTPTMGGVIFLGGITVAVLVFMPRYSGILPVFLLTLCFGIIGFIDDYIKVVLKRSKGLAAWQKFLLQLLVCCGFIFYLHSTGLERVLRIPFTGQSVELPLWLYIPLMIFVILGTDTGTNFTDGIDGLASSVTVIVAAFFAVASILQEGAGEAAPLSGAVFGGLLAFLIFNWHKASVFMGDTGALALGGYVAGVAIEMHMEIYIVIVGIIYLVEVVSVMMQVGYFKMTGGKRIFKMAPIHHHFEKCGWSEVKVVLVFSLVTFMMCLLALGGL